MAQIEAQWERSSSLYLWGPPQLGKTSLAQSLPGIEYFDCEVPSVRRSLEDAPGFLGGRRGRRVVLDHVHRLHNAPQVIQTATEHFSDVRVLAIGPAILGAEGAFGGIPLKAAVQVRLTPMVQADLMDFGNMDLDHRLLHGGLPACFLSSRPPEQDFQPWVDAYWGKAAQELFHLERRAPFQRFIELVLARSGEMFEATRFTADCGVSRGTIKKYLSVLEATGVALVVRPFSSRRGHEIIAAPKVYGFDTGFVCVQRGWGQLRREDLNPLWEHYVLNEIVARMQATAVRYWSDKQGHQASFVCAPADGKPLALGCSWTVSDFDPAGLLAFARNYPQATLLATTTDAELSFKRSYNGVGVEFVGLTEAVSRVSDALR
jgi:uncharacterized protein